MKSFPSLIASFALASTAVSGAAPLSLPEEIEADFQSAQMGEGGALSVAGGREQEFIQYVTSHWRELLDNVEEIRTDQIHQVASIAGTATYATETIGLAAENLPPLDYLDFIDHFLDLYAQGRISDTVLERQITGAGAKHLFLLVNYEHPRVAQIFRRANQLIPAENTGLRELITDFRNGEGADMYFANSSDDEMPPETLPGIKLKTPFESLVAKTRTRAILKIDPEDKGLDRNDGENSGRTLLSAIVANPIRGAVMVILPVLLLLLGLFKAMRSRFRRRRTVAPVR